LVSTYLGSCGNTLSHWANSIGVVSAFLPICHYIGHTQAVRKGAQAQLDNMHEMKNCCRTEADAYAISRLICIWDRGWKSIRHSLAKGRVRVEILYAFGSDLHKFVLSHVEQNAVFKRSQLCLSDCRPTDESGALHAPPTIKAFSAACSKPTFQAYIPWAIASPVPRHAATGCYIIRDSCTRAICTAFANQSVRQPP
jgi:hypothetical protein